MLGGICCTPRALRISRNTTEILIKLVETTARNGIKAAIARTKMRLSGSLMRYVRFFLLRPPPPGSGPDRNACEAHRKAVIDADEIADAHDLTVGPDRHLDPLGCGGRVERHHGAGLPRLQRRQWHRCAAEIEIDGDAEGTEINRGRLTRRPRPLPNFLIHGSNPLGAWRRTVALDQFAIAARPPLSGAT